MACAIVDGDVVTIAYPSAITELHADIGVMTLEPLAWTSLRNLCGLTGSRGTAAARARAGLDQDGRRFCVDPHRRKAWLCGGISTGHDLCCLAGPLATRDLRLDHSTRFPAARLCGLHRIQIP